MRFFVIAVDISTSNRINVEHNLYNCEIQMCSFGSQCITVNSSSATSQKCTHDVFVFFNSAKGITVHGRTSKTASPRPTSMTRLSSSCASSDLTSLFSMTQLSLQKTRRTTATLPPFSPCPPCSSP